MRVRKSTTVNKYSDDQRSLIRSTIFDLYNNKTRWTISYPVSPGMEPITFGRESDKDCEMITIGKYNPDEFVAGYSVNNGKQTDELFFIFWNLKEMGEVMGSDFVEKFKELGEI